MISPENELVRLVPIVQAEGPVEDWLTALEASMRSTLKTLLPACYDAMKKDGNNRRDKWILAKGGQAEYGWPGQLLITAGQIGWTKECEKVLIEAEKSHKQGALRPLKKKWIQLLSKLSDIVRQPLDKLNRLKIIAIITIEVHAREVIDKMAKANVSSQQSFEWLSQLRFYWQCPEGAQKGEETCLVRQTKSEFEYGYEYEGNNGRLVITPLTDRCYMTLTTALSLRRGGLPQGPAGTGKTETVKDLGKGMAKYVIVFNCSDGLDYKRMGQMFSGLAQTGCWSCFDEFNRIGIEVLSVVAQQILSILTAIQEGLTRFVFEGTEISLDWTCGIFVTMNPGYAGRTELPDNLKALLRPISMMVPDLALIAEIMLFSEGFQTAKVLSKKLTTLYHLCQQQLSKQDHYDFGMRAIKSALVAAGMLKRSEPDMQEDMNLFRTLRDMNVPKLIVEDQKLFNGLMGDLFPGIEPPIVDYGSLKRAIELELEARQLQAHPTIVKKTIQLYETKCTRHGNMLVGRTGSGKTVAYKALARAMTRLFEQDGDERYQKVTTFVINPKSVSLNELYGVFDLSTSEWTDGVLSVVMRNCCRDETPKEKWMVLDGPVDTLWIESMNTVLDDNKMLTLTNGERIAMPACVSLLFEVEDLSVASPATVSRTGMVYFEPAELGWEMYVQSYVQKEPNEEKRERMTALFAKFVPKLLEAKHSECKEPVPTGDLQAVMSLVHLFETVATVENGCDLTESEVGAKMFEMWFMYSVIWSIGATTDDESRKKIDMHVREIDAQIPSKATVYDYFVDVKNAQWTGWDTKVRATHAYTSTHARARAHTQRDGGRERET